MALRSISASALLALALTACSGGQPAADDTAAAAAAPEAPVADIPTPQEAAAPEAASAEAPVVEGAPAAEPQKAASAAPVAVPVPAPPVPAVVKVAAVAAPAGYARCAACHTADKGGEDKLGPNLHGVFGAAAAQGGFAYSDALKAAGLKWDEASLHKWLENPRAMVPGNRMSFPGIKDAAKRQEIIDYLKQQS